MTLIEQGIAKGLIAFDENETNINYLKQNFKRSWTMPEEKVRAATYLELVFNYGYEAKSIKFEVGSQQGSGTNRSDIVIYYKNAPTKAFAVIEVKEKDTKDSIDKIRQQARSYAKTEQLKDAEYYAYRIGDNAMVVFDNTNDNESIKLPYNYKEEEIYAFIRSDEEVPPPPPRYVALKSSTPYDLKRIFKACHDIIWNRGEKMHKMRLMNFLNCFS